MARINLNTIPFEQAIIHVRRWQRNRYKNYGNGYGNDDPFITERNMMKKFIVDVQLATKLIDYFQSLDNRYSQYVEHFI